MPLVIITGHPCIGKTRYALELQTWLQDTHSISSNIVNEESLGIVKSIGYANSLAEKSTRGSLKSAVDVALSSKSWIIIDSMNYIKGFRYELHCLAKSIKSTHCTVWITCDEEYSNQWSTDRGAEVGYGEHSPSGGPSDLTTELRRRFEPPNERNRWDRPLIQVSASPSPSPEGPSSSSKISTVKKVSQKAAEVEVEVEAETEAVTSSFRRKGKMSSGASVASSFMRKTSQEKSTVPDALIFNRFDSIREDEGEGEGQGTGKAADTSSTSSFERIYESLSAAINSQPNSSTVPVPHGSADLLYELDRVSQEISHAISSHLSGTRGEHNLQVGAPLRFPAYDRALELHRVVSLTELQRHRLQFVRLNSKHPPPNATAVGSMFIDFLAVQL